MDAKDLIGKTLEITNIDSSPSRHRRPRFCGTVQERDGVLVLGMGREVPAFPLQDAWLEKIEKTPEPLYEGLNTTEFSLISEYFLVISSELNVYDENNSMGRWVRLQNNARKAKRVRWAIAGALVGGVITLGEVLFAEAHIISMFFSILFGAWVGQMLVDKSIKDRKGYLLLWFGSFVMVTLYSQWLQHLYPEGWMCCGTPSSGKKRMILESVFLTVCTLGLLHFLWQFVPKRKKPLAS